MVVFLCNLVQCLKIYAQAKQAIFLFNEKDWGTMQGARGLNETNVQVLVK